MCLFVFAVAASRPGVALTPESPEVKALVAKGVAYLQRTGFVSTGERALAGLALVKADVNKDDTTVLAAVESIRTSNFIETNSPYALGISLNFLATRDHVAHRAEIDRLLAQMLAIQKPHGGWGYTSQATGDTSMTQYGVLSLWELDSRGIPVPPDSMERVANWLLRTQDPSGGFGYQGKDPGAFNNRQPQSEVRNSLTAAGLGSLYIAWDFLKIDAPKQKDKNAPSTLRKVEATAEGAGKPKANIDVGLLKTATDLGDAWTNANFTIKPPQHTYYYLYAYERYRSFKEIHDGVQSTDWYDQGVEFLRSTQAADGSWQGLDGVIPDTCFAMLFLVRSSRKSIEHLKPQRLGKGTLISDKGNLENLGKRLNAKPKALTGPAQDLLQILEDPKNPNHKAAIDTFAEAEITIDDATMSREAAQLRRLSKEATPEARAAVVRLLGRSRDLDNVPTLIYALGDGDGRVVLEAEKGLRFISRKFAGFGPESLKPEPDARKDLIRLWKRWYLAIRPDAEFDD